MFYVDEGDDSDQEPDNAEAVVITSSHARRDNWNSILLLLRIALLSNINEKL